MEVKHIDYRVHSGWLCLLLICGLFSGVKLNATVSRWNAQRGSQQQHREEIAAIERKADLAQAAIDNKVNVYDSVVLTDYSCDPEQAPAFEVAPFVKDQPVKVADQNQRIIGYVDPAGAFVFLPNNCK